MTDVPQGEGWWQAADGRWYPPTQAPGTQEGGTADTGAPPAPGVAGAEPPGPGWWMASDGRWYPPSQTPGYGAPGSPGYGAPGSPGYGAPGYGAPGSPGYGAPGYGAPGYPGYDPLAKSKMAAGLLGIFVGGFGVHRFYLGYTQIGIIQIVVTILTCGIGALWGFVEGIMILVGSEAFRTDATGRPLRE